MAIYHFSMKIIGRGGKSRHGHSAVEAAVYRSGTKIENEWSGITADFSTASAVKAAVLVNDHRSHSDVNALLRADGAAKLAADTGRVHKITIFNRLKLANDSTVSRHMGRIADVEVFPVCLIQPKHLQCAAKTDKARASYYNYYTEQKWGDAKNYHICLDSSCRVWENYYTRGTAPKRNRYARTGTDMSGSSFRAALT